MRLVHRATTSASPAAVWALLGAPRRWPEFDPWMRAVRGGGEEARGGQHLVAVARWVGLPVPVDVREAVPGQRLRLTVHLAPGLRQHVTVVLVEALRGGTRITSSTVVDGPFARPSLVPLWFGTGLMTRLLARRAGREAAGPEGRRAPGAA